VRAFLVSRFDQQDWIEQVAIAVQQAVHNGVTQIGHSHPVAGNAFACDPSRFPARTKAEILASQQEVADARHVAPQEEAREAAAAPAAPPPPQRIILPTDDGWLL